ncbi:MAG: carotenoid biosynthesis protein [Chloroflexi bacterium]|nr:carotenoid biosynthesis protein [Chloroflexota bacterium]
MTVNRGRLQVGGWPADPDRRISRWLAALAAWVLIWIATPIAGRVVGDEIIPAIVTLGVVAQAITTLAALASAWSQKRIARAAAIVLVGAWAVEALGVATGFPFGHYDYTDVLWPQVAGVPLLIPLAWLMMLPPAWAVVAALLGEHRADGWPYRITFAALSGLAFTAWDLYLDPQMVGWGLWTWDVPGAYFGIPWVNFAGWWVASSLFTLLVRPQGLPVRPLMVMYTLVWGFQLIGLGVFWGQPGPALAGFVGMGVFVLNAWRQETQR